MPEYEKPSAAVSNAVREALRVNPELDANGVMLRLTNHSDLWDKPPGMRLAVRMYQLGWVFAELEAEKLAHTTLVSAPPSSLEPVAEDALSVSVPSAVVKWLESLEQSYHAVSIGQAELRLRAYEFGTEDDGRVSFEVDVESRSTESFSGPVK